MNITVYRGAEEHSNSGSVPVFFSSSEDFAKDYGPVKTYSISLSQPFDTTSKEDVEVLLSKVGKVVDGYTGISYSSYKELEESGLLGHDTWELFEPFMNQIERLGYDGMIIYEGGIQNYVTFSDKNYQVLPL